MTNKKKPNHDKTTEKLARRIANLERDVSLLSLQKQLDAAMARIARLEAALDN